MPVVVPLVINGALGKLAPKVKRGKNGERLVEPRHTLLSVYSTMLLQICADYHSLPDPRTLTLAEIRFFYRGLHESLKKTTKPKD